MNSKILSIQSLELFSGQEHILLVSEDTLTLYKINRKTKVSNVQHHDNELIKLFVIEPIVIGDKIIEDTKIISCAFDNVIKIWDFLTMECINKINGPELPRKNVEISSVCYLDSSGLIAVGTDVGHIFFWDLSKSEYLPNTYEKSVRHKGTVTDMITFISYGKENQDHIECLLSCSTDGLILFWEITKTEIKQSNKKYNYDEMEDMIMRKANEIKENNKELDNNIEINKNKENNIIPEKPAKKPYQELKNYKCTPTIKRSIRSSQILKQELQFNSIGFQPNLENKTIFTGVNDYYIYLWDYVKEGFISKERGNNSVVTRMIFDKNFLLTAGVDGIVDIWNIPKEQKMPLNLLISLKDPDITKNNSPRIHDLLMLPSIGVLVTCNNNKKINLWRYEKEELLLSIKKENETTCLACDEGYGKLLCGTKQKIIMEIDLAEQLNSIGYKHTYEKYSFLKNSANYKEDETDKNIDNFKIMKSLTQGIGH
jgi:WD40 repeat protein